MLYGLKQAGRLWNQTLHDHLTSNRYTQLETESCVYIQQEEEKVIIIAVYIDDINMTSNDMKLIEETKDMLKS